MAEIKNNTLPTRNRRRAVLSTWIANIGLLLVLVGVAIPLIAMSRSGAAYKYIFAVGAAAVFIGRAVCPVDREISLRRRRLLRLQMWSGLMFCVAAFCMFYPAMRFTDSLAFTLAGGMLQAYASIMLGRKEKDTPNVKK